jgi:hypothetical protein
LRSKRTASVSTSQFSASPVSITSSTARRLMTGNVPGMPMQIGQVRVFGSSAASSAGAVGQPQNIFDSVRSWAWTSMPMTVSYSVRVLTAMRPIVPRVRRYAARREDR